MRFVSSSPEHTRNIGETLGRLLQSGDIVALVGMLGAGKTVFAQGLARGLDVGPDEYVSSPSFAIVNQYRGRIPIFHIDTYRLANEAEMVSLGYEDYFEPDGVTIIEWADRVRELLPQKFAMVELEITGRNSREIEMIMVGKWPQQITSEIETALSRMSIEIR
jgi:tRNA threonylcarbamoyladenosine biosynthesis protein TsaE